MFIFFTLCSCGEQDELPTIPIETMSKIMGDVHMAEGALLNVPYARKDSMRIVYYEQIYEIHGVSEESFRQDIEYYQTHPKVMEGLYEIVIKNLGKMDQDLKK